MVYLDESGIPVEDTRHTDELGQYPETFRLEEGWSLIIRAGSAGANVRLDPGPDRYGHVIPDAP